MNSTTTKTWLPVHLCPGNLSSPSTQLHIPYDCTTPVIKPVPTVFPASHVPWRYPHSTPLPPAAASAKGSMSRSLLSSQESAYWPASICMVTAWWQAQQDWSLLSSSCSLFLPGGTAWCFFSSFYYCDFHKICWNLTHEISAVLPNFK